MFRLACRAAFRGIRGGLHIAARPPVITDPTADVVPPKSRVTFSRKSLGHPASSRTRIRSTQAARDRTGGARTTAPVG